MNEVFEHRNVYFGVSFKLITFSYFFVHLVSGSEGSKLAYRVLSLTL